MAEEHAGTMTARAVVAERDRDNLKLLSLGARGPWHTFQELRFDFAVSNRHIAEYAPMHQYVDSQAMVKFAQALLAAGLVRREIMKEPLENVFRYSLRLVTEPENEQSKTRE